MIRFRESRPCASDERHSPIAQGFGLAKERLEPEA